MFMPELMQNDIDDTATHSQYSLEVRALRI